MDMLANDWMCWWVRGAHVWEEYLMRGWMTVDETPPKMMLLMMETIKQ